MADHFLQGLENFRQPFSFARSDPNIEFINQDSVINPCHPQPPGLNIHRLVGYPTDNLPPRLPESPGNSENNFSGLLIHDNHSLVPPLTDRIVSNDSDRADKKRKAIETSAPGNSPASSSLQASDNGTRRKKSSGRGKKLKGDVEDEKPREVVHVRAKRGQATDSHSLAERVRREKINEKLRCLQDIIPGCYKTMGMAVMLDEIINYVQSLQNQVEFLSMKLAAASTFYDFNSETDASETIQRAKTIEASKLQTGTNPGLNSAQLAPLYLNFGCNPQFPNSR